MGFVAIEAAILKWTFTITLIEKFARNCTKPFFVLFYKIFFILTLFNIIVTWNNQITILSTNGTGTEMLLFHFLVVGSSPVTDALETERMIT